jgi:hypothetical protein
MATANAELLNALCYGKDNRKAMRASKKVGQTGSFSGKTREQHGIKKALRCSESENERIHNRFESFRQTEVSPTYSFFILV